MNYEIKEIEDLLYVKLDLKQEKQIELILKSDLSHLDKSCEIVDYLGIQRRFNRSALRDYLRKKNP